MSNIRKDGCEDQGGSVGNEEDETLEISAFSKFIKLTGEVNTNEKKEYKLPSTLKLSNLILLRTRTIIFLATGTEWVHSKYSVRE